MAGRNDNSLGSSRSVGYDILSLALRHVKHIRSVN